MDHDSSNITSTVLYMMVYSFVIGYVFSMALLADKESHITFNYNKVYMALLMAFSMGAYELGMMSVEPNIPGLVVLVVLSVLMISVIREQILIDDRQFLLGMIEHHSAALTMSKRIRCKTSDPFILKLTDDILESQNREIEQMQERLDRLNAKN